MGTKQRSLRRVASAAVFALALIGTFSSCIDTRPFHRDRWERSHRTYLERRHDDHRDSRMWNTEPRSWDER